jgi:hypothetical protein
MSAPWIVVIVLLSVAVTALAAAFLTLRRRIVDVLERAETWLATPDLRPPGLQPGNPVGAFRAVRQSGEPLSDLDLRRSASLLILMKAECAVCRSLARELTPRALETLGLGPHAYVVVRDERERDALALDSDLQIVFQQDRAVSWAFRSSATPHAFVVNGDGLVAATGFPNSVDDLRDLVRSTVGRPSQAAPTHAA